MGFLLFQGRHSQPSAANTSDIYDGSEQYVSDINPKNAAGSLIGGTASSRSNSKIDSDTNSDAINPPPQTIVQSDISTVSSESVNQYNDEPQIQVENSTSTEPIVGNAKNPQSTKKDNVHRAEGEDGEVIGYVEGTIT